MNIPSWLKTTLVAAGGGAISGGSAAIMAPDKFGIHFGNGRLALIMLQGALVAVGALFLRSPQGQKMVAGYQKSQAQAAEDKAALDKIKTDIKAK